MFCMTPDQKAACRAAFCASPLGQFTSAGGRQLSFMTGGLLGNCCPQNQASPQDLLLPPDSSLGAAALIKQDEAAAKARRAAVRYLGTVDCRYWPEAEEALINALRADKIECVRWEAAMALQRGCCCTLKIMEALAICVSGSERDGQPAEHSDRVREAAAFALSMCCAVEVPAEPTAAPDEKRDDKLEGGPREGIGPKEGAGIKSSPLREYYRKVAAQPRSRVVAGARRALLQYSQRGQVQPVAGIALEPRPGAGGVLGIVSQSFGSKTVVLGPETYTMPAPMSAAAPVTMSVMTAPPPQVAAAPLEERRGLVPLIITALRGPSSPPAEPGPAPEQRPAIAAYPAAPPANQVVPAGNSGYVTIPTTAVSEHVFINTRGQ
jgi:hypothetical protein